MKNLYLDTPNAAIALNYKVGSSSLSLAVIKAYHPEVVSLLTTSPGTGKGTAYPKGKSVDNTRWHSVAPTIEPSERAVVLLPVRDPVEKFISACAETNVEDVDAKLSELESGINQDVHFLPQSRLVFGVTKLYRFPSDLDALAVEAGLTLPLPNVTGDLAGTKPVLTPEQAARVEAIYADDVELFKSIQEPGQHS